MQHLISLTNIVRPILLLNAFAAVILGATHFYQGQISTGLVACTLGAVSAAIAAFISYMQRKYGETI